MTAYRSGLAAAGLLAALWCAPAVAQTPPPPEQVKAAREVIDLSGAAASLTDVIPIFMDEAKQTFTRTRPEIAKDLDAALKTITPEFEARREQLMTEIASVYAQRFSTKELAEIKAFYTTPTGRKLVESLPNLMQATYQQTEAWSRKMSQDIVARLRQEMRKRGVEI